MKLFLIRYIKISFTYLRLHVLFNWLSPLFLNMYYLTRFSKWASTNDKIPFNDFPSKWNYYKRYDLYKWVIDHEQLSAAALNYLEFGVANGSSFLWFLKNNTHAESRFYGFDTFTGLPEDWGPYKKGAFANDNKPPETSDSRVQFYQGLFQETVPRFLRELDNNRRNVILLDADLYSATLYALTMMAPLLKKDDIILFDDFSVPTHEFKAFHDFVQAYYINLRLIAATNNYYFAAFKVEG